MLAFVALAVMVSMSAVFDDVIVAWYVPSPLFVTLPTAASPLVMIVTVSSATPLAVASFTVALATDVEVPLATSDDGVKVRTMVAAGPNSVRVAVPIFPPLIAEIVSLPGVLDDLIVMVALPSMPVVPIPFDGENVTSPSVPNCTCAAGTGTLLES